MSNRPEDVLREIAADGGEAILHVVECGVFARRFHGELVDVHAHGGSGAQQQRRHGEDAAAAPHVQKRLAGLHGFFQQLQAEARRLMRACAEGQAGVEVEHNAVFARFPAVRLPRGADHQLSPTGMA